MKIPSFLATVFIVCFISVDSNETGIGNFSQQMNALVWTVEGLLMTEEIVELKLSFGNIIADYIISSRLEQEKDWNWNWIANISTEELEQLIGLFGELAPFESVLNRGEKITPIDLSIIPIAVESLAALKEIPRVDLKSVIYLFDKGLHEDFNEFISVAKLFNSLKFFLCINEAEKASILEQTKNLFQFIENVREIEVHSLIEEARSVCRSYNDYFSGDQSKSNYETENPEVLQQLQDCVKHSRTIGKRVRSEFRTPKGFINAVFIDFIETLYTISGKHRLGELLTKPFFTRHESYQKVVWKDLSTLFLNCQEYTRLNMSEKFETARQMDDVYKFQVLKDANDTLTLLEPMNRIIDMMKVIKNKYSEEDEQQNIEDDNTINNSSLLGRLKFMKKLPRRIEEMRNLEPFIKSPIALPSEFLKSGMVGRLHYVRVLSNYLKSFDAFLKNSKHWEYTLGAITTLIGTEASKDDVKKLRDTIEELRFEDEIKQFVSAKIPSIMNNMFDNFNGCVGTVRDELMVLWAQLVGVFGQLELKAVSKNDFRKQIELIETSFRLHDILMRMKTKMSNFAELVGEDEVFSLQGMKQFYRDVEPLLSANDAAKAIEISKSLQSSTVNATRFKEEYLKIRVALNMEVFRVENSNTSIDTLECVFANFKFNGTCEPEKDFFFNQFLNIAASWKRKRTIEIVRKFHPDFMNFDKQYKQFYENDSLDSIWALEELTKVLNESNKSNLNLFDFKKSDEITKLKSTIGGAQANIREAIKKVVSFMEMVFKNRSLEEDINFWEDSNVYALFRNKNNTEKWFQKFEKMMPSGKDKELIETNQLTDGLKNMKQLQEYISDVFKFLENDYNCNSETDSESIYCRGFKSIDWAVETPNYGRYVKKNEEDKEKIYSKRVQSFEEYSSIHLSEFENESPIAFIITLTIGIIGILSVFSVSMWLSIRVFLGARLNRSFMSKVESNFTPFEHEDDEEPNPFFVGCNEEYLMIETDYDGMKFVDKDRFKKKIKSQYPLFEKTLLVLNKNPYPATTIEVSKFKTYIATEIPNLQNSEMFLDILLKQPANVAIQISGPDEYFMDFTKYVNHGKYHVQAIPKHTEIEGMNRFVLVIRDLDGELEPVLVHFFHIYCWSEIQETDIISTILDTIEWSLEVHLPHYSTVVCCKNGSGRTMTFITCIQLRILMDEHKFARFSNEVMRMRKQRFGSVDNVSQFAIIWMVTLLWRARLDLNRYGDVYLRLQKLYENDLDLLAEESAAGPCEDLILKDD